MSVVHVEKPFEYLKQITMLGLSLFLLNSEGKAMLLEAILSGIGVAFLTIIDYILYYALIEYANIDPQLALLVVICGSINSVRLKIKS